MQRTPDRLARALKVLRYNRQDLARVGLQTAVATVATYVIATWLVPGQISWAVMAALFTIGLSADASYYSARGRLVGAFLGIGLGLAAGWAAPSAVLPGLVIAVVLANMLATLWPSTRYSAATAAIIALEPTPSLAEAGVVAGAILCGTLIAAVTSLALWPTFGRTRVVYSLRQTLIDCRDLLTLICDQPGPEGRAARDTLHGRFLGNLEACHERIASTRFGAVLPNGVSLREAASAAESLWHSIVILDRAVTDEFDAIGAATLRDLSPTIQEVARRVAAELDAMTAALGSGGRALPSGRVGEAVAEAQDRVDSHLAHRDSDAAQARGLHALLFALTEIERRLRHVRATVRSEQDAPRSEGAGAPDGGRPAERSSGS